jgi:hypothetical protein
MQRKIKILIRSFAVTLPQAEAAYFNFVSPKFAIFSKNMSQSGGEIKMNLPRGQTINRSISRDGKSREILSEKKLHPEPVEVNEPSSSRREFFSALLPVSSKVFTNILRAAKTTLSSVVEDAKTSKKPSKK